MNKPDKLQQDEISSGKNLDAVEEDDTPVLDEQDLEDHDLSVEDAEDIEWEKPKEDDE